MTILAGCMAALYFAAVGVAFLNDRRRARRDNYSQYADDDVSPIEPVSPVDAPAWGTHRQDDDDVVGRVPSQTVSAASHCRGRANGPAPV